MADKHGYIYILTNVTGLSFYCGATSDLKKRVFQHKQKLVDGFTKKYNLNKLIYYEIYDSIQDAIEREKQIKSGPRKKKIALIMKTNPDFKDLYDEI